jgi:hypothetical protein
LNVNPNTHSSLSDLADDVTDFGREAYEAERQSRAPYSTLSASTFHQGRPPKKKRSLQRKLFSVLHRSHKEKKGFFPWGVLSALITETCVRDELGNHRKSFEDPSDGFIEIMVRRICKESASFDQCVTGQKSKEQKLGGFRRIFVILVLIEKTPDIVKFLEEGVSDSDLPLNKVERHREKGVYDLRLSRDPSRRLKCFRKKWSQLHIRLFEEWQWTCLAPFFAKCEYKDVKHYRLQDEVILPFTYDGRRDDADVHRMLEFEGGFGKVFKAEIHADHHNFHDSTTSSNRFFAIKRLHSQDRKQFSKEVEMLKRFSNNRHAHLISLLATYEQFNNFFLVFHWADTDLQRYWKQMYPSPSIDIKTVLWMVNQCKGIADGVMNIHKYASSNSKVLSTTVSPDFKFGHHGDIKPENVLLFSDMDSNHPGILKLSDFGLAEFSIHRTVSMMPKSVFAMSPPYRAPEVDLEGKDVIGRQYDMWSLGCLYLEFITWMLGGWDLVNYFYELRKAPDYYLFGALSDNFFELRKRGYKGKPQAMVKKKVTTVSSYIIFPYFLVWYYLLTYD